MANQNLFNALHELGIIALESEMQDIVNAVNNDGGLHSNNKSQYYVMAKGGNTPPRYKHNDLQSAITEAQRLSRVYKCDCEVLEIAAAVIRTEVISIEEKIVICGAANEPQTIYPDDLPF